MEGRQLQFLELYRMVLADGIAHPKEMETLYRIGVENYGLTNHQGDCRRKFFHFHTPNSRRQDQITLRTCSYCVGRWSNRRVGEEITKTICNFIWHQRRIIRRIRRLLA